MRITLHIGPDGWAATRVQDILAEKRGQLAGIGVLFPRAPGPKNHTRAFMAVSQYVDTLRFNRGFALPEDQAQLRKDVHEGLAREIDAVQPDHLILSAHQFGTALWHRSEIEALRDLVRPFSDDIDIVAQVEAPADLLARHYTSQVFEGRARSLEMEHSLADQDNWWEAAVATAPDSNPAQGIYPEVQMAPAFLDFKNWTALWDDVFGAGATRLVPLDLATLEGPRAPRAVAELFGLSERLGKVDPAKRPALPSADWLERGRAYNDMVLRLLAKRDLILPRQLWRRMVGELRVGGAALSPAHLGKITEHFSAHQDNILAQHSGLSAEDLAPSEADAMHHDTSASEQGFEAAHHLLANLPRIEAATKEEREAKSEALARLGNAGSMQAPDHLPPQAQEHYTKLLTSPFAPHNRIGTRDEETVEAPYAAITPRVLPKGSSGHVIVGCMKNEAPYIVEWVAYHRAMGIDNFLIYTNGCEDGTTEILDRLDAMGVVQHRNNDDWKGKSPQQHALNQALKEPVVKNAEWLIHIDVDEFINVRCGNGTLSDFLEQVPDATNVAMTWRLFGHNGVADLDNDRFVIDQFDTCAPKYCPKPHTVWGFKTMFRNIGAYEKMSCHRPNKLRDGHENAVRWVNGSGQPMEQSVKTQGWRSSKKSIGYDLLQLNHYALRSAESFLIKRQRGRALHVDRSIGLNYWIRMDWSDFKDVTIQRNGPRLKAEFDRLMQDETLAKWHAKGQEWHRAKADELHGIPEFEDLYQQALKLRLNETERVAYALSLDMES